ncbi:MAG: class I SAM-dependent methyltransferase [Planctomycetes bacterium]|nr:class I SAM-dependent methyltransferase [Planctomycetota bacterium]
MPGEALPAPAAAAALAEVPCHLCGGRSQRLLFEDAPWRVVRCADCSLVYTTPHPDPEALRALYGESYWRSPAAAERGYTDYLRDEPHYLRTYRRRLRLVRRHAPRPGRALDVGCAAGYFLRVLAEAGWEVHGVEVSPFVARFARERHGLDSIRVGSLEEAGFPPASFDLVTFWDVVEHLPDPRSALRAARGLVRPTGLLLLETQNVRSLAARLLGRRWQHFKQPEHLYHFDPDTIARLLAEAGFEVVENRPFFGGKYVPLAFAVERSGRISPLLPRLLRPFARSSLALYVNLFDEMVVVARPR